jgi:hypothetical protein
VILGSSLSARLLKDSIPGSTNLAFGGHGIHDGLQLLLRSELRPAYVFIETDFYTREASADLLSSTIDPIPYHLRAWFPVLRDGKQPAAVARMYSAPLLADGLARLKALLPAEHVATTTSDTTGSTRLVDRAVEFHSRPTDAKAIVKALDDLSRDIGLLEKRGATIVLFEMPVDPRISSLPEWRMLQRRLRERFPEERYAYLNTSSPSTPYTTTDGIHLDKPSAARYSGHFQQARMELKKGATAQSR